MSELRQEPPLEQIIEQRDYWCKLYHERTTEAQTYRDKWMESLAHNKKLLTLAMHSVDCPWYRQPYCKCGFRDAQKYVIGEEL